MEELHFLHRTITAKREAAAALLEELKQYDEEAFDNGELVLKNKKDEPVQPVPKEPEPQKPVQQQIQNKPEKKNNRIKIAAIIAIVFSMLYFTNYTDAKQEVIEQKYTQAMRDYQKAYNKERDKTESDIAVTVKNTLVSNNSVGNEWYIENYANNVPIHLVNSVLIENDNTIHLKFGNPITVETYIAEDDTWPDTAKNKYKHTFSKADLIGGCYITQTTYVQENNGRYQGNTAKWETRYDFKAIMNYPKKPKQEDFTASFAEVNNKMLEDLFN